MFEKRFVKKRKRRIAAVFGGVISSIGIGALVTIAFLGRYVGTFTVTLDTSSVKLSLSQDKEFLQSTTVLTIDTLPPYHEWTYHNIKQNEAILDSEDTDYLTGAVYESLEDEQARVNPSSLDFFKYTFYVKNVGSVTAGYTFELLIKENRPEDGPKKRKLDSTLRVAIYQNDANEDEHHSTVYAKSSTRPSVIDGIPKYKEFISVSEDKATASNPCYGFAEEFLSDYTIAKLNVTNFKHDDINRYTIITWLEGFDPESDNNFDAPLGASLKLGVEIKAYEIN